MIYEGNLNAVGNTPLIKITDEKLDNINFYIKFEGYNPTGSVKDRAAQYVLNKVLRTGEINKDTTIIESSSGNFGIALSSYCKDLNLKCKIVIDPNILPVNEFIIRSHATDVIKVTEHDETGGFYDMKQLKDLHDYTQPRYRWHEILLELKARIQNYRQPENQQHSPIWPFYRIVSGEEPTFSSLPSLLLLIKRGHRTTYFLRRCGMSLASKGNTSYTSTSSDNFKTTISTHLRFV